MLHLRQNSAHGIILATTDGASGSSGKGLLNQFLAVQAGINWNVATCNFMPNAGHTVTLSDGSRIVTQQLPSSFLNPNVILAINAGAAIEVPLLLEEIVRLESLGYSIRDRLMIHPNAAIITEAEKDTERQLIKSGSTFKGCGAALSRKALRLGIRACEVPELEQFVDYDYQQKMLAWAEGGANILIEGAQGVDLDLNQGQYPYVTSRQTTPAALITDAGIPINLVSGVILNWRTHPIRISNESAADGSHKYSGDCFGAPEIDWDTVATEAGFTPEEFMGLYRNSLTTTVTKKVRRVFRFPKDRADYVFRMCGGPGFVQNSLNFLNWVDRDADGVTEKVEKWLSDNWTPQMRESLTLVRWGELPDQVAPI